MPLFVPTGIAESFEHFDRRTVVKGQLYNLDEQRIIGFQFNPEMLDINEEFGWTETGFRGAPSVDLAYTGTKLRTFDLTLRYVADPIAPDFETSNTITPVKVDYVKADFDKILAELRHWMEPLEGKGRPCRAAVIFGDPHNYEGVITALNPSYKRMFDNATARYSELRISFKEWSPLF